jgi:transglutaminase-like putative cysteine protease
LKLNVQFRAELETTEPTPAFAMFEATAAPAVNIVHSASVMITTGVDSEPFKDFYGNPCRRMMMPQGVLTVNYDAIVEPIAPILIAESDVDPEVLKIPSEVALYTLPSRYCPSDQMGRIAQDLFGNARPGFDRVNDICQWINERVLYSYGFSTLATTAYDTANQRIGVCRDFAHLGVAFCRALNIPARYVSGYCYGLKTQDLHAWFQAYIGGNWINFDATEIEPRQALAQIAIGRDAADCAWWTCFGTSQTNFMSVSVTENW